MMKKMLFNTFPGLQFNAGNCRINYFRKIRIFPTFPLDFSSGVDPSSQFHTLCHGMEDKFVTSSESR